MKEASARIKINKLLEEAGWRFFEQDGKPANIRLEPTVTIKQEDLDALGESFEKASRGFVDFLLLDSSGYPLIVLEAKAEDKNPLIGKEQAREYAKSLKCRFIILSNGTAHYFWDLQHGNPFLITSFPTPESVTGYKKVEKNPQTLVDEVVESDYIVRTQKLNYDSEAGWKNESERSEFVSKNRLKFLRPYQLGALHAVQCAVSEDKERFLLEMATGTGKTLTSAAIIKLFLRTGNASRVLFLVDRLELEDQAKKSFSALLSADFQTVIYKESRDDWRKAEIVVTTVQSLLFNNKYQRQFSPTDFDLVISDEAHRSIGGNARAVFDYFVGYKLGLTATPRDYLKKFDDSQVSYSDPRESERRLMLDTYRTFGCESGQPTYRYSLLDGVKDGFLINPTVVDVRTEVTAQLLSQDGFLVKFNDVEGGESEEAYKQREFEKRFFSEPTNQVMCKTFVENALRDPISGEVGKSIVFAVSQNHASKLVQVFNKIADVVFPGKYQSDFAIQVTSEVPDSQQFTINFANNNLLGSGNFMPEYRTSKARICVTVGMMTTGYDCPDILNLGLFRPIFSPTDFIQIKGRGTRKHDFTEQLHDERLKAEVGTRPKAEFKLFDFFANCEFFESEFNYDEVLKLPKPGSGRPDDGPVFVDEGAPIDDYSHLGRDIIESMKVETVGVEGMKIDRMFFTTFEELVRADEKIAKAAEEDRWDQLEDYITKEIFDKPEQFYTLEKLRKGAAADRPVTIREIVEKALGYITNFKTKDELLEEEFSKFVTDYRPQDPDAIPAIKTYFKAYVTSERVRHIIENKDYTDLATNPMFTLNDFKAVPNEFREIVPRYVQDYVPLKEFKN